MPLLTLKGITVAFGGPPVLDHVDLVVEPRERLCLLGRNGAGKSTLLRVILGDQDVSTGEIVRAPELRISYLAQRVPEEIGGSVLSLVMSGAGAAVKVPIEEHVARAAISRTGLSPEAEVETLSAGLRRRALLAAALASDPDLLLLDEPTNHLDVDSIGWLEEFLRRQTKAVLFVTHDRALLRRVATGILDLDRGELRRHGPDFDRYLEEREERLHAESKAATEADRKRAAEEKWIRQGVRERRKRNMGRVRRLYEMREDRAARREAPGIAKMETPSGPPSGRLVFETKNLGFAYGDVPVVRDFSLRVLRGDRVGIIGPNGSGKTTLLRLLTGELTPESGELRLGTNLEIAVFDQLHADLDLDATAVENVGEGSETIVVNGRERHVVGYLGDFLFPSDRVRHPIRGFSGGERNRLLLARLFARPSNLLVLDEPTNDLDVETLEVLEDLLADYGGTVLLVSHDRELLSHCASTLLVLETGGKVTAFDGGYAEWEARRKEQEEAARPAPKRGGSPSRPRPRAGLSYREQQELEKLPARIEELEARQAEHHRDMADPTFFRRPREEIAAAHAALEALAEEIRVAYARWEELEAKNSGNR